MFEIDLSGFYFSIFLPENTIFFDVFLRKKRGKITEKEKVESISLKYFIKNLTMDKLKELIDLLNFNKIKSIEIIDNKTDSNTKLMELYRGIQKGKFENDEQAKVFLYPDQNSNAYYKLKHTLRERLYNTMFFIDAKSSKHSDILNAKLNIQKIIGLVQILRTKGLRRNAIYMSKKGLIIAERYEFTEERLILARILRLHAATMLGDQKQFKIYDDLVNESSELLRSELKIEGLFLQSITLYVNDKSTKPYIYDQTSKYLEELKPYTPAKQSANWIYYHALIQVTKHMSINDYQKTLNICDEALSKINKLDFKHTKSIINISSQAVVCCIQLKSYEKGESNIFMALDIMIPGIFNWFKYKELHLTLCFHTKRYAKAMEIFNEVNNHKKFKHLRASVKETWKIFDAWLHFFLEAEKIPKERDSKSRNFRISRYANDVPTFSKDKRGLNIPILISQIALLLQQKKHDVVLDRMDAIAKYKDRYIDKTHNYRSNIFIRMLLTVPKGLFKRKLVIELSKKYRALLDEVPLEMANQNADINILPYEDIWDVLLEQLK